MHDPIGSASLGRLPSVENKSFLHSDNLVAPRTDDLLVQTGGLPITGVGSPVRPVPVRILDLLSAKKVPLILRVTYFVAKIRLKNHEASFVKLLIT